MGPWPQSHLWTCLGRSRSLCRVFRFNFVPKIEDFYLMLSGVFFVSSMSSKMFVVFFQFFPVCLDFLFFFSQKIKGSNRRLDYNRRPFTQLKSEFSIDA